jgi:hypothetical protein
MHHLGETKMPTIERYRRVDIVDDVPNLNRGHDQILIVSCQMILHRVAVTAQTPAHPRSPTWRQRLGNPSSWGNARGLHQVEQAGVQLGGDPELVAGQVGPLARVEGEVVQPGPVFGVVAVDPVAVLVKAPAVITGRSDGAVILDTPLAKAVQQLSELGIGKGDLLLVQLLDPRNVGAFNGGEGTFDIPLVIQTSEQRVGYTHRRRDDVRIG